MCQFIHFQIIQHITSKKAIVKNQIHIIVIFIKRKDGGLGYVSSKSDGCVVRGIGRNVKANRAKTQQTIDGYMTISCMQNAMVTSREAYNTLVESL